MKKTAFLIIILLISGCVSESMDQVSDLSLKSPEFEHNSQMPAKYACINYQGQDINPALIINGMPVGTKSLVLIMDDPDAPVGTWVHWIVYNIPATTTSINEDSVPGTQGVNSWGRSDYGGPCPPSGQHRYVFKLYALDTNLDLTNPDKTVLENEMQGHIIGQTQLIGLFP